MTGPTTPDRPTAPAPATPPAPATAPAPAPVPAAAAVPARTPGTTSTALTPAQLWRRSRGLILAVAALLAAGLLLATFNSGKQHGYLDPRSADPEGSRAVAELLKQHGVTSRVVTTTREAAAATGKGTTLLVTAPDLLGEQQRTTLRTAMDRSGGRTILLGADDALNSLAPGVRSRSATTDEVLSPDCTLPAAATAGRAATGDGLRYTTDRPGAVRCYPSGGGPTLLVLPATGGGDTVLLGSERILLNEELAKEGNASLALQLLGSRPEVVWYLPSLADRSEGAGDEEKSLGDLIPAGWSWALLQLFLAAAVAAVWRARRLGPLVTERLPVVIRASEATEGRARLYHKADARDRAATVLRAATRERLAALLGVPAARAHDPATLLPAVSAHLLDPTRDLTGLLFGPAPSDDAALVALADHLDALEREVRTS
ncbi:DUF4350 domain-containing protein [Streptomyces sp. NPDC090022]|uniref:DUF4350 domain-containing protein n=1 Tax=Streptomyces sp. NPDC090022 TaxID=3365920 RepID=UPI003801EB03